MKSKSKTDGRAWRGIRAHICTEWPGGFNEASLDISLLVPQRAHVVHQLRDLVPGAAFLLQQNPTRCLLDGELLLQHVHLLLQPLVARPLLRVASQQPFAQHLICTNRSKRVRVQ